MEDTSQMSETERALRERLVEPEDRSPRFIRALEIAEKQLSENYVSKAN